MLPQIVVIVLLFLHQTQCAKILAVFPIPAPSHYILGNSLLKSLAENGHDVTMISAFEEKNPPKNGSYRDILITGLLEQHQKMHKTFKPFEMAQANMFIMLPFMTQMIRDTTEFTLNSSNVQKFLKSKEKFDVVIVEQFLNEAHKGFANHFGAPLIVFSTIGANIWTNILNGNPAPPSYVPDTLLTFSSKMNFWERSYNALFGVYSQLLYHLYAFPKQRALYEKYFPNNEKSFDEMLYNPPLVLLNSHVSINQPVPFVPNMIDIGGFHVQPPKKLPNDLQQYLDNAKDGVIYFSMGSNLKSVDLPITKRDALLKVFAKLKYQILWKWEDDILPNQPKNVKLGKWLPQQDILAHPNIKLFITHGGLLSTTETIYHGVPVLAIPVFGDQAMNAQRIVNAGFGLMLKFKELNENSLLEKINEIVENPKYRKNAKLRSKLFHDRPIKPIDSAQYWVNYVIRHNGATHLNVAMDLPWYKYLLLDVIFVLSVIMFIIFYISYKIIISVFRCCFRHKANTKKVKKT